MNDPKNLANSTEVLRENLTDAQAPGHQTNLDPGEAERGEDLVALDDDQNPVVIITEGEPITDLPSFFDTETVHSLYGWQPGESLEEAIARRKIQEQ